jgi:regulator of protease activity HflC (stomatin/prohibitin superfamily)
MSQVAAAQRGFSKIKEMVAVWSNIRQLLRSGDDGYLVPVVIPKDRRSFGWAFMLALALYIVATGVVSPLLPVGLAVLPALVLVVLAAVWFWRQAIVEVEQGTTGLLSNWGEVVRSLEPGRHYLWWPWQRVTAIVDTSTEIPYTAPVLACPTKESVPLKSIEFFLKFRIEDPVKLVRHIGASNFDIVLSSVVQDAIRRRSREVETARAYDLRGSDVGDMRDAINRKLSQYGVRVLGANIPEVQLPDQYQQNLATREHVAKELEAYEKEWELKRKQRTDTLMLEIEKAKKERDAKEIAVRAAINKAREDIARTLQQKETEALKVRLGIEANGRSELTAAENEAKALERLGQAYRDNWAVLRYQLARRQLDVAERLATQAPRPIVVNAESGDASALSTLLLAKLVPDMLEHESPAAPAPPAATSHGPADRQRREIFDEPEAFE